MTESTNNAAAEPSEELILLRSMSKKLDGIESQIGEVKKQAVVYGAGAGGISGGLVALGIMFAKNKLGL